MPVVSLKLDNILPDYQYSALLLAFAIDPSTSVASSELNICIYTIVTDLKVTTLCLHHSILRYHYISL
jgi:hypothetical protein